MRPQSINAPFADGEGGVFSNVLAMWRKVCYTIIAISIVIKGERL